MRVVAGRHRLEHCPLRCRLRPRHPVPIPAVADQGHQDSRRQEVSGPRAPENRRGLRATATMSARSRCPRIDRTRRLPAGETAPPSRSPDAAWGIHFRRFVLPNCRSGHGLVSSPPPAASSTRRRTSRGLATRADERSRVPHFRAHISNSRSSGSAPTFSRASATRARDDGPRATG